MAFQSPWLFNRYASHLKQLLMVRYFLFYYVGHCSIFGALQDYERASPIKPSIFAIYFEFENVVDFRLV